MGLGLAISHSIMERHKGNIEVQSESGRGTTFTITLPWDAERDIEKDAEQGHRGRRSERNMRAATVTAAREVNTWKHKADC